MWKSSGGNMNGDKSTIMTIGEYTTTQVEEPSEAGRAWSPEEHLRFLDGLEVYGHEKSNGSSWNLIASYVQTRNEIETKLHGERYLHALLTQSLLVSKSDEKNTWTGEEDKQFETALAQWIHTPHAWTKIAMQLPGKTVYDVMDRYDSLVRDLTAMENGLEPQPLVHIHESNMTMISNIANANDNTVLYDVFKEAHDNPCSLDIATYVASAVVGMITSNGQTKQRTRQKQIKDEKKITKKKSPKKKLKSVKSIWDLGETKKKQQTKNNFILPPLDGKHRKFY